MLDIALLNWLPLAPLALLIYGWVNSFLSPGLRPVTSLALARSLSLLVLICAAGLWFRLIGGGAWSLDLGTFGVFPVLLRVDILSASLFTLVSLVAAICLDYSRNYLDGDARQGDFFASMLLTQAAVSLLILAGSLTVFWIAWVGVSLALHQLLVFYSERPRARRAAWKKFIVARLSDTALLVAFICLTIGSGTSDIALIADFIGADEGAAGFWLPVAGLMIALAACLKSAQIPAHGWLTEVMETPTPVSAFLHAGIVNAGGFLVLRFADVMWAVPEALWMLAVVGGTTALIASAVMMFQPAIKVALAWSTIAQMGFMLMQCGFGAFSAATLHIIAHSFYKAYAFLSSGSVIDLRRSLAYAAPLETGSAGVKILLLVAAAAGFVAFGLWGADTLALNPAALVLGLVLVLGLGNFILRELDGVSAPRFAAALFAAAAGLAALYVLVQAAAAAIFAPALPAVAELSGVALVLLVLTGLGFTGLAVAQLVADRHSRSGKTTALRIHLANGLYLGAWLDRLVLRLMPEPPQSGSGRPVSRRFEGDVA